MKTIRALCIAPYEGMKTLMSGLAGEFPEMELTLFVGDLEEGVAIAQKNFHGNYDVVISRGGTARLLREHLSLPVVEIEISMYDILCALKLAEGQIRHVAVISYAQTGGEVKNLCSLLGYDIDVYTLESREKAESTLRRIREMDYSAVLCDTIANTTAQRLGLNSFLITSGADSIRRAFHNAVQLCRAQERQKNENDFLRRLVNGQIGDTVVFTPQGELFLSSTEGEHPELVDLLRRELAENGGVREQRITRMVGGLLYSIHFRRISLGEQEYAAFFVTSRKSPLSANPSGIRFFSRAEAERSFYDSIFSYASAIVDYREQIDAVGLSAAPVMISGEDGTGKGSIVQLLYIRSALSSHSLISVNCSLLKEKSWDFLLNHYDSPLADVDNTLFFSNVDMLSPERCEALLSALRQMDVCRRNRVLFSCVCQPGESMSPMGARIADALSCLTVYLSPLRRMADRIPPLVNLTLSHLNVAMPRQIIGASPEAMHMLQTFSWPRNFAQFRRVLQELAATSPENVITAAHVNQVLRKERYTAAFTSAEETAVPLDLNRTMDEITRDIARRVLEESGGNQTLAAKRLGISRTTLWRLQKG